MKNHITLFISALLLTASCFAQNLQLAGVATSGGANNTGITFKMGLDGSDFIPTHSFAPVEGIYLYGTPIEGSDGKLYGTTGGGGEHNYGTIFSVNKDGTGYIELHSFNGEEGGYPFALKLLENSNGKLMGMAQGGAAYGKGVVFSIDKNGDNYEVLHEFDGALGDSPNFELTEASDGRVYGSTTSGGDNGRGVLFSMLTDGSDFVVLHHFDSAANPPRGTLTEASDGRLYGVTDLGGGPDNAGALYTIGKDGTGFTVLASFQFSNDIGLFPLGGVIQAADGKLYGTCFSSATNAGTVWRANTDGSEMELLHAFSDNGWFLFNNVTIGSDGYLYGMAWSGGLNQMGFAFRLSTDGTELSILKEFDDNSGGGPFGNLLEGSDGNWYGMTNGANGVGSLFSMLPNGGDFANLVTLSGANEDGRSPSFGLLGASDGKLYGLTTNGGGTNDAGVIFRSDAQGGNFELMHEFDGGEEGGRPSGKLMEASDGRLYGLANQGIIGAGVIYAIEKDGSGYQVLHQFDDVNGRGPLGALTEGQDGRLYGMTNEAGGNPPGSGSIFGINKDGTGFLMLKKLDFSEAAFPRDGRLVQLPNGFLYGVAFFGGPDQSLPANGVIFRINPDGSAFAVLHQFTGNEAGSYPAGGLLLSSDGLLYGTTNAGGSSNSGTVYAFNPSNNNLVLLHNFDEGLGESPSGALLEGPDGRLFGTTTYGGEQGLGTVFSINLDGTGFSVLHHFSGDANSGSYPGNDLLLVTVPSAVGGVLEKPRLLQIYPNPASADFTFDLSGLTDPAETLTASVRDAGGRVLFLLENTPLSGIAPAINEAASGWQTGVYLVELRAKGGVWGNKLVLLRQ